MVSQGSAGISQAGLVYFPQREGKRMTVTLKGDSAPHIDHPTNRELLNSQCS
jgi:hypothetical protein